MRADISTAKHFKDTTKNVTKMASKDGKKDVPEDSQTRSVSAGEMMNQTHDVNEKHWISQGVTQTQKANKANILRYHR